MPVGRSTVREALRAPGGAGLVQPRQGAGVLVTATRTVEDWPTRLRRAAVTDGYEVRMAVEVHAALVRVVADEDAEGAAEILRAELEDPFAG